jgi:hypothetical protein
MMGLPVPVAARATPPLLEVHVAVYFGVVSGLPFACAAVSNVNPTFNQPAATRATPGVATRAGAPTTIAADGADAGLVPALVVSVTVHVYVRLSVRAPTPMVAAVEPTCVADLVTPPLLDLHVAVNFVIGRPFPEPAT